MQTHDRAATRPTVTGMFNQDPQHRRRCSRWLQAEHSDACEGLWPVLVSERPHSGTLFSCSEHRRKVAFRRLRTIVNLHESCALINTALMRSRYHPVRESCSDGSRAGGLQSARRRWTAPTSARRFCGLFSWAGKRVKLLRVCKLR